MLSPEQYEKLLEWVGEQKTKVFEIEHRHGKMWLWVYDRERLHGHGLFLDEVTEKDRDQLKPLDITFL